MSWTIIVSPVSGKRRGKEFAEKQLIPELESRQIAYELIVTTHSQHAKEAAKGKERIIIVGGDGTINEVLSTCPIGASVAVVSQGTMNFFSVCADLPNTAKELVDLIASHSLRPSSVLTVETAPGQPQQVSFEALHIGKMAYNVCQGASEWRSTLGPMFGIVLNLLVGCALPAAQMGTLKLWQADGTQVRLENQAFYWIIATYRNPYNGVVGNDLWLSWMTVDKYPGFGRMMQFFEPQMEHFQGTSRCFPNCARVTRFEFECTGREYEQVALVLDGDAKPDQGRRVVGVHRDRAWNLVADPALPKQVNPNKIAVGGGPKVSPKTVTHHAQTWLTMNPVPRGVHFPAPAAAPATESANKPGNKGWVPLLLLLAVAAAGYYARQRQLKLE